VARRRVRSTGQWRQPLLPGLLTQVDEQRLGDTGRAAAAATVAAGTPAWVTALVGPATGADWERAWFREGCRYACRLATVALDDLEGQVHACRPGGYVVEGWRERTLVTQFGDMRVRRRLYRAPDGAAHFLLDEHLGWVRGQAATPAFATLLVEWATDMPFRTAARRVGEATAGVVSGSTVWRLLQQLATRVTAHEQVTHATWAETAAVPAPEGERVVPVLYLEADGVWVKTQREPTHRTGYELKCASMYEGWEWLAGPTPGHPRPHYRLQEKQVYCHGHMRADARAPIPFWDGVSLALSRTYDLSQIPVVVVGGDGANWIDTALEGFSQAVRQRDGFHLARDAGRGWGPETGATLYQAVRAGTQATATALLALLALPTPQRPVAVLPPPASSTASPATDATHGDRTRKSTRSTTWSAAQIQRARATFTGQVGTLDGAVDWRLQVSPDLVPPGARGLGTQEGTNAHLLAKRMKHKGMAWRATGAHAMAKARELVTNGGYAALTPWCHRPAPPTRHSPRYPGGYTGVGPLPWPQASCPTTHGPLSDPTAAILRHIDTGARSRHRLS
jgi:hypothetical protein